MKALLASAEASPFAKVGGLADVVGSLPIALRKLSIDARVILPDYGFINHSAHAMQPALQFALPHRLGNSQVTLYSCERAGVPFYLLRSLPYFGAESAVYSSWDWDIARFVFFNQALMAALHHLGAELGWQPDIVHVNDWHTGLLPFMLQAHGDGRAAPATVMGLHNLAYQGQGAGGFLWDAGIESRDHPDLRALGLADNLLAIGIACSDMLATVSPRYAVEIMHPYAGFELAPLLRQRAGDLRGILNGLDTQEYDPATDSALYANFDSRNFTRRRPLNKRHLQSQAGLAVDSAIPLVGIVSRLAAQKGFDLALPALRNLLGARALQVVALGTGEDWLEQAFWQLAQDFPEQARAFLQYDDAMARMMYAGCDIFLMPSHFEPCGMGQMIAMRYGALPLARETGGLADTVVNYDNGDGAGGTGFVFQWQEAQAVQGTLAWALDTFRDRPGAWRRMQERAMLQDFSWDNSARHYMNLYETAIARAINRIAS